MSIVSYCKITPQIILSLILLAVIGISSSVVAQETVMRRIEFDSDSDVFMLAELGVILTSKDSSIVVEHTLPRDSRPEKYRKIDVRQGDRIVMVNGARVRTPTQLAEKYEALETGQMFKMAIKRNNAMMIVSFEKASKEDLGNTTVVTQFIDDDSHDEMATMPGDAHQIKMIAGDGDNMDVEVLAELGLLISYNGEKIAVMSIIPMLSKIPEMHNIVEGDVITSIQGKPAGSFDNFKTIYSRVKAGEELTLEIDRDGEVRQLSFPKPEAKDLKIIRQDK